MKIAQTVTAQAITAQAVTAQAVTAQAVTAQTVTAQAVTARAVTARAGAARPVTAQTVTAKAITAQAGAARRGACAVDAELVVYRLEEAGATLLALPGTGWTTRLRTSSLEIVRTALESYGWADQRVRPAIPSAARIDRMDEALGWIALIPQDRYVLRRIVGARALVSPTTERHLYTWRRLGVVLGADHKAVQRWHGQAVDIIVAALNRAG